ncbi:MAG: hypothetical protein KDI15_12790 [Thiothrix sp.]|nr:hypothetical protein [Thiothrix sp.]HPE61592.1 hypothetical protein [Thiolinea sp.]
MARQAGRKPQARWFFPTNSVNVRIMLAQGLLAGHDGFLEKYYQDLLVLCPGWIPLFRNSVDSQVFPWIVREASHLSPCLLELDLSGFDLSGNIRVFRDGYWSEQPFSELEALDIEVMLLPAPLPLGMIRKILFADQSVLQAFRKDCDMRGNTVLDPKILSATRTDAKLFSLPDRDMFADDNMPIPVPALFDAGTGNGLPAPDAVRPDRQPDYRSVYAWGGMLALLFYMAKNGRLSHEFYRLLVQGELAEIKAQYGELYSLLAGLLEPEQHEHAIHRSEREQIDAEITKIAIHADNVRDSLLSFFAHHPWQDEKVRARATQLLQTLKQFATGSDISRKPSDYFSRETFLGRNLLMLFYRDSSAEWLRADAPLPGQFDEQQLLGFALLFGLRDRFTGIAPFLRRYRHLQNYLSLLMARYAHQCMGAAVHFAEPASGPETVWGLLQKKASRKKLVDRLKLKHCISSTFTVREFTYEGGKLVIPGVVEPDYQISESGYYQEMHARMIDDTTYNKMVK